MLILGIDPGISNLGWALVDVWFDRKYEVISAGTFSAISYRRTEIRKIPSRTTKTGKTFRARRVREVVPGSLSASENDTQRCGQIFRHVDGIVTARRGAKIRAIVMEDRMLDTAWSMATNTSMQGVLAAVECAAVLHGISRDLIPVKDVHAALAVKIPRRKSKEDPKPDVKGIVGAAVREVVDCSIIDETILDKKGKPSKTLRVHAMDAIGIVIAASMLEYTRTYRLLEELD